MTSAPRVFGLDPGVDFPQALVDGLTERLSGKGPVDWARVTIIVNTRRMFRRLRQIFDAGPPRLLPRILLLTEIDRLLPGLGGPPPISPLRRRLELVTLIAKMIEIEPTIAPRASLYDLADSLADLIDEMQGEGVEPEQISNIDVSNFSEHFEKTRSFIEIARQYIAATSDGEDGEARQRRIAHDLIENWRNDPPASPIILAGSTGSRGTTQMLMQAVANLPQGAVVLPGFDFDMPDRVWSHLSSALLAEDHPQYRFFRLLQGLEIGPGDVKPWIDTAPPSAPRNRLVSLALRPAPVTDSWQSEGPELTALEAATQDMTLVEADSPRAEALAIALRLRQATKDGQTAALITPDRMLSRQVTAALDRWSVLPDDSAGTPLHLSPAGRFLRHVASVLTRKLDAEALLTLLKHPLTHSGLERNLHQLNTQRLELAIRRNGLPYPDANGLRSIANKVDTRDKAAFDAWLNWVATEVCRPPAPGLLPLENWVRRHLDRAEAIACGPAAQESDLWQKQAGEQALAAMNDLAAHANYGGAMDGRDYADLVGGILSQGEVRDRDAPHPDVMIWGTLEARVQGADLVILSGLNEGVWPEAPKPDPWLNRKMRHEAGLLLPERKIGLAAHDFQQAVAARHVWITRSIRSEDSETVPSRWLNRMQNLLSGLPEQGGPEALADMRARGKAWLLKARKLEDFDVVDRVSRPSPRPPVAARPRRLSVTEIKHLIRDPYAIYARHCLRLEPLGPLVQTADALQKGRVLHDVMESFIKATLRDRTALSPEHLIETARSVLHDEVPWPAARALWLAGLARNAEQFVEEEIARQEKATPLGFESDIKGSFELKSVDMTLSARADRFDMKPDGSIIVYDYKTGTPPTKPQQKHFDKQLLVEALMIEEGAFELVGPSQVAAAVFLGIGRNMKQEAAPLEGEPPGQIRLHLEQLFGAYRNPNQGYTSRRAHFQQRDTGDYDQLARFGEWDESDAPVPEDVG